jgi:plasmid stability protein
MSSVCIKNIPDHLHARLKEQALRNRRSLNQEIVLLLEAAVSGGTGRRPDADDVLAAALASRKRCRGVLSDKELARARTTGRA